MIIRPVSRASPPGRIVGLRLTMKVSVISLNSPAYGTHTMRRTRATLIYKWPKNLRPVQLLLGHMKLESAVRYLGIEVDDALEISEKPKSGYCPTAILLTTPSARFLARCSVRAIRHWRPLLLYGPTLGVVVINSIIEATGGKTIGYWSCGCDDRL